MDSNHNERLPLFYLPSLTSRNPDGHLSSRASRGGLSSLGDDMRGRELVEMELRIERMKEEMVQRRLLEEDVRRELLSIKTERWGTEGLRPPAAGPPDSMVRHPPVPDAKRVQPGNRLELGYGGGRLRVDERMIGEPQSLVGNEGTRMISQSRVFAGIEGTRMNSEPPVFAGIEGARMIGEPPVFAGDDGARMIGEPRVFAGDEGPRMIGEPRVFAGNEGPGMMSEPRAFAGNEGPGMIGEPCVFAGNEGARMTGGSHMLAGNEGARMVGKPRMLGGNEEARLIREPPIFTSNEGARMTGKSHIFASNKGTRMIGEPPIFAGNEGARMMGKTHIFASNEGARMVGDPSIFTGNEGARMMGEPCIFAGNEGAQMMWEPSTITGNEGVRMIGEPHILAGNEQARMTREPHIFASNERVRMIGEPRNFADSEGGRMMGEPHILAGKEQARMIGEPCIFSSNERVRMTGEPHNFANNVGARMIREPHIFPGTEGKRMIVGPRIFPGNEGARMIGEPHIFPGNYDVRMIGEPHIFTSSKEASMILEPRVLASNEEARMVSKPHAVHQPRNAVDVDKRSEVDRTGGDLRVVRPNVVVVDEGERMSRRPRFTRAIDDTSPVITVVGAKRKSRVAAKIEGFPAKIEGFPQPSTKEWSCALCKVNTTSKLDLDAHLAGKKHLANMAMLNGSKSLVDVTTSSSLKTDKKPVQVLLGKRLKVEHATEQKAEDPTEAKFLCEICKIACNSSAALESHLRGKKHKAQLENLYPQAANDAEKSGSICIEGKHGANQDAGAKQAQDAPIHVLENSNPQAAVSAEKSGSISIKRGKGANEDVEAKLLSKKSVGTKQAQDTPTHVEKASSANGGTLCNASATSKLHLDEQFVRKKHVASVNVSDSQDDVATRSSSKKTKKPVQDLPKKEQKLQHAKKQKSEDQTVPKFRCEICKIVCNSDTTLLAHLRGLKHKAQLGSSDSNAGNDIKNGGPTSIGRMGDTS